MFFLFLGCSKTILFAYLVHLLVGLQKDLVIFRDGLERANTRFFLGLFFWFCFFVCFVLFCTAQFFSRHPLQGQEPPRHHDLQLVFRCCLPNYPARTLRIWIVCSLQRPPVSPSKEGCAKRRVAGWTLLWPPLQEKWLSAQRAPGSKIGTWWPCRRLRGRMPVGFPRGLMEASPG